MMMTFFDFAKYLAIAIGVIAGAIFAADLVVAALVWVTVRILI